MSGIQLIFNKYFLKNNDDDNDTNPHNKYKGNPKPRKHNLDQVGLSQVSKVMYTSESGCPELESQFNH